MTTHTIKRSFLVRQVQTYTYDMADQADPQHMIDNHLAEFDNELMMFATLVSEEVETVDYDELKLEVVDRESARVLPFQRKGDRR